MLVTSLHIIIAHLLLLQKSVFIQGCFFSNNSSYICDRPSFSEVNMSVAITFVSLNVLYELRKWDEPLLELVNARVCWDAFRTGCFNASVWISARRLSRYQQFKDFQRRILVATNLFGRGMDIERVNIVFNYDMPEDSDTYLHRVRVQPCVCECSRSPRTRVSHSLVSFSGGSCWALWHQGFGRHIRVRWNRCQNPERRAGPIWGQRGRVTRGDRHFHLQWVFGLVFWAWRNEPW